MFIRLNFFQFHIRKALEVFYNLKLFFAAQVIADVVIKKF